MSQSSKGAWHRTRACQSGAHCWACRSSSAWRSSVVRVGLADTVDFACPRGLPIVPEPAGDGGASLSHPQSFATSAAAADEFAPCDGCPHHVLAPPNGADACGLLGDQPCALNARIRDGGPWPLGCRRARVVAPQSLPTTDSTNRSEVAPPRRGGCCNGGRSDVERAWASGAARYGVAPEPAMLGGRSGVWERNWKT